MDYYGAKELADSFRTVRKNTLQIAEDIPEDKYSFRAAPDVRSVGEELAHIACSTWWQQQLHAHDKKDKVSFDDFMSYMTRAGDMEKALSTKAQIIDALQKNGDEFATFLEGMSSQLLAERVGFPPPVQPASKSRFEMVLAVKEHELHHRAKLMLVERILGIVPHLTRSRQQPAQQRTSGRA